MAENPGNRPWRWPQQYPEGTRTSRGRCGRLETDDSAPKTGSLSGVAAMATALGLRCLYRTRPAAFCRHVDRLWRNPCRGHRLSPADDELYQRTRISLLQNEFPQAMYIDSYNSRGFTISGSRVFGPCVLLPQTVVQWNRSLWWAPETRLSGCTLKYCRA
ncbi:NADH dehydrogenase [ubiquinone] 1 alpha subcomplex assembly factor 3 isoform X2 [Mastomys coucha]|uniref:NADH dehydrogenase [ubiquinone] 1 alpha subcomplex assembly factor 3 isoform X2 n=1 Tax=Mastomys coucha TaxID=35658 RepID=UPI001261BB54|nr:NADH dehydrogenase [ubiquinone] 1 alpha subcomplex assembly factor 3 isoform X2 [Mastomys coucha]